MSFTLVEHPLARQWVTRLRDSSTQPAEYRRLTRGLALILALQATSCLRTRVMQVRTPLETCEGSEIAQPVAVVPILRAGLGMLDAVLELFPHADVGFVGMERDEATAVARTYVSKFPPLSGRYCLLLDPMLATGGSASDAIGRLKSAEVEQICLLSVVAAPEGVARVESEHPDVAIYAAALDRELNAVKFILPGLGDFGDRLYGSEG